MTPSKVEADNGGFHIEETTVEEAISQYGIKSSTPELTRLAAWNGHEFEVLEALIIARGPTAVAVFRDTYEYEMLIHFPIDPRMIPSDIAGATRAYPNATNDGWLFAHCDADFHLDQEIRIGADIVSLFQPEIDERMLTVITARETVRTAALDKYNNLVRFRNGVLAVAELEAKSVHLGWYHQNPHESHLHSRILLAIEKTKTAWNNSPELKYSSVSGVVDPILSELKNPHPYETRWDMAARLEAEQKAEKSGETQDQRETSQGE